MLIIAQSDIAGTMFMNSSTALYGFEDGEEFTCDEEPHMLGPELGYGYYPVALGQFIHGGKLEIVRKLGWATSSSVWLARTHE